MRAIRKWIRDIFGFSGNEINGFLILIPVMLLLVFSEPIYIILVANREISNLADEKKLDSLVAHWPAPPLDSSRNNFKRLGTHFFPFDPNQATVEQLGSLGFSRTLANRIAAYRLKGGTFRIKSDLIKIYGLDSTLYHQLYSYILLPVRPIPARSRQKEELRGSKPGVKTQELTFDINTADTLILKTINGIGSILAARIVKFREGLGGFIDPHQLREVYGLDSVVVNRLLKKSFIKEGFIPLKINVNTIDEKKLSAHPYIRYKIARTLVTYRFQHGDFMEVSDIKKLTNISPEDFEKFLPYVKVKD